MKQYVVKAALFIHRGRAYHPGDLVALDDEMAAIQLKAKNVTEPPQTKEAN